MHEVHRIREDELIDSGDPACCMRVLAAPHLVRLIAPVFLIIAFVLVCVPGSAQSWQRAVDQATATVPESRIVVIDVANGHLIASHRPDLAARTLAAPGSTLKPLLLFTLVSSGRWQPDQRISCNGQLVVNGRRLACSHPPAPPFDSQEALTWSCNTYFAAVARSLNPGDLGRILRPTGILSPTRLEGNEAIAKFSEPPTVEARELAVLGVDGVRVTPLELAVAYRWLALELAAHKNSEAANVVRAGLEDSASFGMAGAVGLGGVPAAGKTGTAESAGSSQTHGWFAGLAPAVNPRVVVVVYMPSGRGADAARVAGDLLARSQLGRP